MDNTILLSSSGISASQRGGLVSFHFQNSDPWVMASWLVRGWWLLLLARLVVIRCLDGGHPACVRLLPRARAFLCSPLPPPWLAVAVVWPPCRFFVFFIVSVCLTEIFNYYKARRLLPFCL